MEEERRMEITSKPFQRSKARIATNSTLVQPFILGGGASLSQSRASQPSQPALFITGVISLGDGWLARLSLSRKRKRKRERLLGVAAVTQLRPHLICLKYTAPPAEVLMATRPHPLLSLSPPFSFFFPPLFPLSRAPFEPRTATMPRGRGGAGSRIIDARIFFLFFFFPRKRGGERALIAANSRR